MFTYSQFLKKSAHCARLVFGVEFNWIPSGVTASIRHAHILTQHLRVRLLFSHHQDVAMERRAGRSSDVWLSFGFEGEIGIFVAHSYAA